VRVSKLRLIAKKNQGHQYVTEDELLLVIGVEGAIVHNHGRLASNPVQDTAIAWFELLCPAISLQEVTRVPKLCVMIRLKTIHIG
jgi:phosphoglycolate phosphatase